jgi:hypothetical protein
MSDRTATPQGPPARAQRAGGDGPVSGRLVVGEYVGQLAADAAQAVRRAGLKPGLDRSFECEPELLGLVVAQDPVAGSDLARNGMVTLYVAATGAATVDEIQESADRDRDSAPISVPPLQAVGEHDSQSEVPQRTSVGRRRKPRLATSTTRVFDRPPDQIASSGEPAGEAPTELVQVPPAREWIAEVEANAPVPADEEESGQSVFDDHVDEESMSREEFVVHADDVFAGRTNTGLPAWRRAYPSRRKVRAARGFPSARSGLRAHRWLVRGAGVMLLVWVLVAVLAALLGHSGGARQTRAVAGVVRHASVVGVHRGLRPRPRPRPLRVKPAQAARRHPQARVRPRPRAMPLSAAPAAPVSRVVARPVAPASALAPVSTRVVDRPTAAAREFGPEQQHGGPFSP